MNEFFLWVLTSHLSTIVSASVQIQCMINYWFMDSLDFSQVDSSIKMFLSAQMLQPYLLPLGGGGIKD